MTICKIKKGFTLLELLIVLFILSVLYTIAVPSYERYVLKTKFDEAKKTIQALMFAQERYKASFGTYYFSSDIIRNEKVIADRLDVSLNDSNNFVYSIERADSRNYIIYAHLRPTAYSVCFDENEKSECIESGKLDADTWLTNYNTSLDNHFIRIRYPVFYKVGEEALLNAIIDFFNYIFGGSVEHVTEITNVENGFDYSNIYTGM